ncbi:MAG: outer membrane beta-barrel protein [Chitinophagaceae bacterium]
MKSFLIAFLLLTISCHSAFAQDEMNEEEKTPVQTPLRIPTTFGNYLVGANLLFANATFQKGTDANYSVGIAPKVGVFILPNIALGLNLSFNVQGNKSSRTIDYAASPFARVYFAHNNANQAARPIQFFLEGGIGYGGTNSEYDIPGGTSKVSTNGLHVYGFPGVDYFLNEHVAAELGLQYQFIGGHPNANILSLNLGFQIFLGR